MQVFRLLRFLAGTFVIIVSFKPSKQVSPIAIHVGFNQPEAFMDGFLCQFGKTCLCKIYRININKPLICLTGYADFISGFFLAILAILAYLLVFVFSFHQKNGIP